MISDSSRFLCVCNYFTYFFLFRYSNKSNLSFYNSDSKAAVVDDLKIFRNLGGSAIVENTSHGLKRNVAFLKDVSIVTGVHVIAGTGNAAKYKRLNNYFDNCFKGWDPRFHNYI